MSGEEPWRLEQPDAIARAGEAASHYAVLLKRGTLEVGMYAPRDRDPQQPHLQDELYVVVRGSSTFVRGDESRACGPGDVLFVPAGMLHHFEGFTEDFAAWAVFYGPPGGEAT